MQCAITHVIMSLMIDDPQENETGGQDVNPDGEDSGEDTGSADTI